MWTEKKGGPITEFKVLTLSYDVNLSQLYFTVLNDQILSGRELAEDERKKLEKRTSRRQN